MRSPWWRRNIGWVIALIPLLICATLACSQRTFNQYLPRNPLNRIETQPRQGTLHQRYTESGTAFSLDVTVSVRDVQAVDQHENVRADTGAQLWRVDLDFEAEPDQVLVGCTAELETDGVRYGGGGGKIAASNNGLSPSNSQTCTPSDTPGPSFDLDGTTLIETTPPRPRNWSISLTFALPTGVTPQALRLSWYAPDYLYIPL